MTGTTSSTWPVQPLSTAANAGAVSWLVFADPALGSDIGRVLGDDVSVTVMSQAVLADDSAGAALLDSLGSASNVLYAPDVSSERFDAEAGYQLFNAARRLTATLATMAIAATAVHADPARPPRTIVANPAHAILWGLGRTLALEHPEIWGGVIDLGESAPAERTDVDGAIKVDSSMPVGPIKDVWRVCEPEQRRGLLRDHVGVLVAAVMGLPSPQSLNPSADFFELGMDSLMSVVLQRALAETLGEVIEQSVVFDYPTVEALAELPGHDRRRRSGTRPGRSIRESELSAMAGAPSDRRAIITEALRKIDELSARLEIAEKGDTEPIAVVGMGCRLPGGVNSPDEFWRLLQDGRSGIVRVPAERWDADAFYSEDYTVPGTICTREGGFITSWQPDEFDAEFFGISPREAAAMDPQQRLVLEVAWEALENAGIPPHAIHGTQTSIFVGMTAYDYMLTLAERLRPEDYDAYVPFGNAANFAAGRLSYFLGVRGPAVVIDTACSSSLVSVHLACQSLRRRESDTAIAAGVNLMLRPEANMALTRFGMLSPDGQCKSFDAGADGYVRSEGCGVVVLKRLSDALADGDRVLAVVRGSAVNQDGASSGQTVPNGPAQQALIRQALAVVAVGALRYRLHRGPRHRHRAGRPDRTGRAQPGVR